MSAHNVKGTKSKKNLDKRILKWQGTITNPTNTTPRPNDRNFRRPGSRKKS